MSILDIFKNDKDKNPAEKAKERLKIIISHQRNSAAINNLLPKMQKDIVSVVEKYIEGIAEEQIDIKLQQKESSSILELNVVLPAS